MVRVRVRVIRVIRLGWLITDQAGLTGQGDLVPLAYPITYDNKPWYI